MMPPSVRRLILRAIREADIIPRVERGAALAVARETEVAMSKPPATGTERRVLPEDARSRKALHLAETTDLSEGQARELIDKHGIDSPELDKEAQRFKAEG